jgi:hypothetical protein
MAVSTLQRLVDLGVEALIRAARATHDVCTDVAYAALRDLDLEYQEYAFGDPKCGDVKRV